MAGIEYQRLDLRLTIHRANDGGAVVRIEEPGGGEYALAAHLVKLWIANWDQVVPDLSLAPGLGAALAVWTERVAAAPWNTLRRLVLVITDAELASLAWEANTLLMPVRVAPQTALVVRDSLVRPRALTLPFTYPLRMVQVDPSPFYSLSTSVLGLFGSRAPSEVTEAVQTLSCTWKDLALWRGEWPSAEVLHFDNYPLDRDLDVLLSTANSDREGTLGWLARLAATWQTRLVLLRTSTLRQAAQARRLAQALVARGGPAVLVSTVPDPHIAAYFLEFYDKLIHDYPLDIAWRAAEQKGNPRYPLEQRATLFVGSGREESLRVSTVGQGLADLQADLAIPRAELRTGAAGDLLNLFDRTVSDPMDTLNRVQNELVSFAQKWPMLQFNLHESEGYLPVAAKLNTLRRLAGTTKPSRQRAEVSKEPRWVNTRLWEDRANGNVHFLPQREARLDVGRTYQLSLQIGPKDLAVRTLDGRALLEEVFQWTPDMQGVWLEIGVTGLDFDLLGDPVQEMWLPKEGASDPVYFAVVPRASGVSRVRFCVYFRQDVLQSFRLAAYTGGPASAKEVRRRAYLLAEAAGFPSEWAEEFWYRAERQLLAEWEARVRREAHLLAAAAGFPEGGADEFWYLAERRLRLADALDVQPDAVGDAGYLTRMEYSLVPTPETIMSKTARLDRTLSLVANDLDGETVVTVKGADVYNVLADGNIPRYVENVRKALDDAVTRRVPLHRPDLWRYPYGQGNEPNDGAPDTVKDALQKLALVGWELYNQVIPKDQPTRDKLRRQLEGEGKIIQVAHVLLGKAIPWAVLYEQKFTPNKQRTPDGRRMTTEACLACLPGPEGKLKGSKCGDLPDCPLHPAQELRRRAAGLDAVDEETVACPRHFWGFRHLIELPPQQTQPTVAANGTIREAQAQYDRIENTRPAQMAAGSHLGLLLWNNHWTELQQLVQRLNQGVVWKSRSHHRDKILADLAAADLDLIYLYCHARDRDPDNPKAAAYRPQLEFWDQTDLPGTITTDDLALPKGGAPWAHHPLVFLNGCGTIGLSPHAMSEFIKELVWGRQAAGVIGTEVPVPEALATGTALHFLEGFLGGYSAGKALLWARRWLLSRRNPLGLIYTLYAAADLVLAAPPIPPPVWLTSVLPTSTPTIVPENDAVNNGGAQVPRNVKAEVED